MEISDALKNDIKEIQSGIIKCIQNHQALVLKLKEDPALEAEIKVELTLIQKQIVELNDKQKTLLQQLRKELEENITNGQVPAYNFNLYKVKPGQLESKKRRRKDLSLAPKVVSCRPTHSPPSLSPSPTPSSSSLSDDSVDYVSPSMMPIPVPKARPKLLPDVKDSAYLATVNRRDLRPARLRKNQKPLSDEEVFKDIPVYYDPVPSPPPVDEKDLKARFMGALALIPKEMLNEILNRKVERKRRSTATNNPNFVYNNDWEIPAVSRYNQWKRSKIYLSPHKVSKTENSKKCKIEDYPETRQLRQERKAENEKLAKLNLDELKLPPGLVVEKVDAKSRNSTPDSSASNPLCFVCRSSGTLTTCRECTASYHAACVSPSASGSCPNCKHKKSHDEGSSEESGKEEFVSKCPNVAESYNKLKKYIEHHTDSDAPPTYTDRESVKLQLLVKNQELYNEKHKLEERATELSEALLIQEDSKNELMKQERAILAKIKVITDFVELFQKTNEKKITQTNEPDGNEDGKKEEKGEGQDNDDNDNDNDNVNDNENENGNDNDNENENDNGNEIENGNENYNNDNDNYGIDHDGDDNGNSQIVNGEMVEEEPKSEGEEIQKEQEEEEMRKEQEGEEIRKELEEQDAEEDDVDEEEENEEDDEVVGEDEDDEEEKCLSSGSSHTVEDVIPETQPLLSVENIPESPIDDEKNCEGIFEVSKGSLLIDISTETSSGSPSAASKDSTLNNILELDEGEEEQCILQSAEKSSGGSEGVEYETPSSEPEFY